MGRAEESTSSGTKVRTDDRLCVSRVAGKIKGAEGEEDRGDGRGSQGQTCVYDTCRRLDNECEWVGEEYAVAERSVDE